MKGAILSALAREAIDSPDPANLLASARSMLEAGRPAAARPLVAALERLNPGAPELAELKATLAAAEGRVPEALDTLSRTLAENAGDVKARMRRAGLFYRAGNIELALGDAAEAVIAAPEDAGPKTLLGLLLLEKGEVEQALACLRDALATDPSDPGIRVGLAEAALRAGDKELARATVTEGMARAPYRLDLRRVAVRVALVHGDLAGAAALAEEARRSGLVDSLLLRMQADAEVALGREGEALEHRKLAFELDPSDPALRAQAAALGLVTVPERLLPSVIARWFDQVADSFDNAMVAVGDRVPGLVRAAILANCTLKPGTSLGPVLDLGCGTGLVAIATSDLALGPWIGIDASPRMLALARGRDLYAELIEKDVIEYLGTTSRSFPLIIAADIFSTFGDLTDVFTAAARRLVPDGHFIFSVEEAADAAPTPPGPTGFYVHSRAALERAAWNAGLVVATIASEPLREEHGAAVAGLIAVLSRAPTRNV